MEKLKRRRREKRRKHLGLERLLRGLPRPSAPIDCTALNTVSIPKGYRMSIVDDSITLPLLFSPSISFVHEIKKVVTGARNEHGKAKAIFDWMQENVQYDHNKADGTYKTAHEVFIDGLGVCGEMAFLYITMARCCGLRSNYVSVRRDCHGDSVYHACASVYPDNREILVDPAYHQFGIRHRTYTILNDSQMLTRFLNWRQEEPFVQEARPRKQTFMEWLMEG